MKYISNILERLKYAYISDILSQNKDTKIVGLDIGTKKVGTAIFYSELQLVLPSNIIKPEINAIVAFITQNNAIAVVLGYPLNMNDTANNKSNDIIKLQESLQKILEIPVILQDERLTTYVANEILKNIGMKRKKRNRIDDTIAAKLILEEFINKLNIKT